MRRQNPQLSLYCSRIEHDHAKELAMIDRILEDNSRIKELVEQDLFRGLSNPETGAPGSHSAHLLDIISIISIPPISPCSKPFPGPQEATEPVSAGR